MYYMAKSGEEVPGCEGRCPYCNEGLKDPEARYDQEGYSEYTWTCWRCGARIVHTRYPPESDNWHEPAADGKEEPRWTSHPITFGAHWNVPPEVVDEFNAYLRLEAYVGPFGRVAYPRGAGSYTFTIGDNGGELNVALVNGNMHCISVPYMANGIARPALDTLGGVIGAMRQQIVDFEALCRTMWADVELFCTPRPEDGVALVVNRKYVATMNDPSALGDLRAVFERFGQATLCSFQVLTCTVDPQGFDLPGDWEQCVAFYRPDLYRGPHWPQTRLPWTGTPTCHLEPEP
jgi:hypothetical protein